MSKFKTQDLLDQLKIQGDYPYAAGYLMSYIEGLAYTLKLTAKQEKILREDIMNHTQAMAIRNEKKGAA